MIDAAFAISRSPAGQYTLTRPRLTVHRSYICATRDNLLQNSITCESELTEIILMLLCKCSLHNNKDLNIK
jgi:hypothetical protein